MDPWKHVNQAWIISAGTEAGWGEGGLVAQSDRSYISREEGVQGNCKVAIIRVPSHLQFIFFGPNNGKDLFY